MIAVRAVVTDTAADTGITKASIYYHVSGKEELLERGIRLGLDALFSMLDEPGARLGSADARLRHVLVRTVEINKKKMDICDSCHMANDEMRMAEAQKRSDELESKRLKEEQLRAKQPNVMPQKMQKGSTPK